jgi:hypothetical protein
MTNYSTDRTAAANKRYKTLGFKWLFELSAPHQVRCNLTGNRPQSPTFHTANRCVEFEPTAGL